VKFAKSRGGLVPVGSPEKLSTAIQETLDDPIDGRPRAEDFRLDCAVESYLDILNI